MHTHAVIVDIHLDGLRRDDDAHADVRRVRVPQRVGDSLLHDAVQMFAALERKAERRLRLDPNLETRSGIGRHRIGKATQRLQKVAIRVLKGRNASSQLSAQVHRLVAVVDEEVDEGAIDARIA